MWRLKCIVIGILGLWLLIPKVALESAFQIDKATDNMKLRQTTNHGSIAFLQGAAGVLQAMRMLDEGKNKDAKETGMQAVNDFKMAGSKFTEAANQIKNSDQLKDELNVFLSKVKYAERAANLGISPKSSLWVSLVEIATRKQGAIVLFEDAANRAKSKEELTKGFFNAVTAEKYNAIQGGKLLVQIGADLIFGAYVSAIFASE